MALLDGNSAKLDFTRFLACLGPAPAVYRPCADKRPPGPISRHPKAAFGPGSVVPVGRAGPSGELPRYLIKRLFFEICSDHSQAHVWCSVTPQLRKRPQIDPKTP